MEVSAGFIYAISVLENLRLFSVLVFAISLAVTVCSLVSLFFEEEARHKPFAKAGAVCLIVSLLLMTFVPSGKTLAAMYVIPPIVNSAAVQELPSELVDVAREWLDELRPNRGKSK